MTTCEKHGCPLKELLTSTYCPRCDEEAAVNADVSKIMKHVYSHDADGKELQFGSPHHTHDAGWYHNYPVCGTDANGSDVDDMDVCMGFADRLESVVMWLELGFVDAESAASMLGAAHEFASTLDSIVERRKDIRRAQESPQPDVCMGLVVGDFVVVNRPHASYFGIPCLVVKNQDGFACSWIVPIDAPGEPRCLPNTYLSKVSIAIR